MWPSRVVGGQSLRRALQVKPGVQHTIVGLRLPAAAMNDLILRTPRNSRHRSTGVSAAFLVALLGLAGCTPPNFSARAVPGTPAKTVLEMFGEPDSRNREPDAWVGMAKSPACIPKDRIKSSWRYSPLVHDDAIIFFDSAERVVCVMEGGVMFDTVHI